VLDCCFKAWEVLVLLQFYPDNKSYYQRSWGVGSEIHWPNQVWKYLVVHPSYYLRNWHLPLILLIWPPVHHFEPLLGHTVL